MSLRNKLIALLLFVLAVYGGGIWTGYQIPRGPVTPVESVFTPYEDGTAAYLKFLDRAQKSVHMSVYVLTEPRIVDKLIELKTQRKVDVHVLLDLSQTKGWSGDDEAKLIARMRAVGIEVVIGTSPKSKAIMHHKFTVVDGVWVQDGSWNYTRLANRQANVLNFDYNRERALEFLGRWHEMHAFMKAQMEAGDDAEEEEEEEPEQKPAPKPKRKR
jgi:phosphatidylserine/phosphatidylglycerophosphate/cardiolipin synthase-like enzyme